MNNTMINKMKNSAFGKFLRRIAGEETGAVMMEYVIVAVLVAAAAVIAIAYFGRTVTSEANVATTAMTGEGHKAQEMLQDTRDKVVKPGTAEAAANADKFSDATDGQSVMKK